MPWNSNSPIGSLSVKANRPFMNQNTTYIETTMGNSPVGTNTVSTRDHFWDVGSDEDGRHRFIQSPAFTVGGTPADPVIGTGMDCVEYPKLTSGRVERFHRNAQGIYQHVPSFMQGSIPIPSSSSYTTIVAVPDNTYGEIFMWSSVLSVTAYFYATGGVCRAFTSPIFLSPPFSTSDNVILRFSNLDSSDLNIRARRNSDFSALTWEYRITYRTM